MILTACSEDFQIARGMKRDHLTREQVLARLAKQMPLEDKKRFVDYVIDTEGPKEQTIKEVEHVYADLKKQQAAAQ
jgi:dephospho-CoA kinase